MSATERALALFRAGVPVRDIGSLVGMSGEPLRELLTRQGERPRTSATVTYMARVCPFHDSCRDCSFQTCALDKLRPVSVLSLIHI